MCFKKRKQGEGIEEGVRVFLFDQSPAKEQERRVLRQAQLAPHGATGFFFILFFVFFYAIVYGFDARWLDHAKRHKRIVPAGRHGEEPVNLA